MIHDDDVVRHDDNKNIIREYNYMFLPVRRPQISNKGVDMYSAMSVA